MTIDYPTLMGGKTTEGSIKNWCNNAIVPSSILLPIAEQYIYRRLRVWQMLEIATGTMTISDDTETVPERYLAPRVMRITGLDSAPIVHKLPERVEELANYDSDGNRVNDKPLSFYVRGTEIQFDHTPDKTYPYRMLYYKEPAALDGSNTTNLLTTTHPRLLMSALLWAAHDWLRNNEERLYHERVVSDQINAANVESDAEQGASLELDVRVR